MSTKSIAPVKTEAAYEVVARQIRRAIQLGDFVAGDRLPRERDLADQLGVARMTVREAIKVLAAQGLLSVRRGAQGGTTIEPQQISKRELLTLAADAKRAVSDVFEFRAVVEGTAAQLAAGRATVKELRPLRAVVREMTLITSDEAARSDPRNVARFLALDSQFHLIIGRLSGNVLLSDAVERALQERFLPVGALFGAIAANANEGHEEILEAIAAGHAGKAADLMSAHIQSTKREVLAILSKIKAER